VDEALGLLAKEDARILAGGTDFYPAAGERPVVDNVVDISNLATLRGVTTEASHIRIGGLTTWTDVIRTPLPRCFDALKSAAREVGSIQIQNRGTVAGNLCNASPAADGVPPLLALDAQVELVSRAGIRRMALAEFMVGNRKTQRRPDELLSAVLVPRNVENAAAAFSKLGARKYLVISITMVAVVASLNGDRVSDARIAVGSCSAAAKRLTLLEQSLRGAPVDYIEKLVKPEHLAPLSPIDDIRATAEYRGDASLTLIRRTLRACVGAN
jgi:CO/xanthine dehydrogenase FAD-binding subunit